MARGKAVHISAILSRNENFPFRMREVLTFTKLWQSLHRAQDTGLPEDGVW
jgi:hypothetical protein